MTSGDDPRAARSRAAIIEAARALLLAHGPSAVTHQRIADHARIGRATVYRHWPRTAELLAEAMATVRMPFFLEPRRPFRAWLLQDLTDIARQLEQADVLAVTTTLVNAALWDPDMDARRDGFASALQTRLAAALIEAQQDGEVRLAVEPHAAAALVIGPVFYRATIEHACTDDAFIEHCVDGVGAWRSEARASDADEGPHERSASSYPDRA